MDNSPVFSLKTTGPIFWSSLAPEAAANALKSTLVGFPLSISMVKILSVSKVALPKFWLSVPPVAPPESELKSTVVGSPFSISIVRTLLPSNEAPLKFWLSVPPAPKSGARSTVLAVFVMPRIVSSSVKF